MLKTSGKVSRARKANLLERRPVARDGVCVEEDDPAGGDLQRAWLVLSLVLEVQQVLPEFVLGDLVRRLVKVGGKLPDGAEVMRSAYLRRGRPIAGPGACADEAWCS